MTISRLSGQDCNNSSATTSVTATYGSATTTGNLLIAVVYSNTATGTNAMSGWNKRLDVAVTAAISVTLFDKISAADTTAPATASGASVMQILAFEYSGNANPIVTDGSGSKGTQSTNTAITIPTTGITTTLAGDLIFEFTGQSTTNGGFVSWTHASNLQANTQNRLIAGQYLPGTTVSTYTDVCTWTTTRTNGGGMVAYEAATATNTAGLLPVF